MLKKQHISEISRIFTVLSDPTRLHILRELMDSPKSVGQIVHALGYKQANVSKQLGVLRRAGLVRGTRAANVITYRITNPIVKKLCRVVCAEIPD